MSAVGVSESVVRPILAEAVDLARRALLELEPFGVGMHLGVTTEDDSAATHHFEATLPGYRGWQWAVVVAAPPEATRVTVSESALLPGPDALVAPDFLPWDQRIRPGDLGPGDLLAPLQDDPRLVPGYLITGDPVVDEVALELGLGRSRVLSREGREDAADRWFSEFGPDTDMARAAPAACGVCGFFVPLAGALRAGFGVCANAMGADGHVVHRDYGCGAHSDTELPTGAGSPAFEAYDDAAFDIVPESEFRTREQLAAIENASRETESAAENNETSTVDANVELVADAEVELVTDVNDESTLDANGEPVSEVGIEPATAVSIPPGTEAVEEYAAEVSIEPAADPSDTPGGVGTALNDCDAEDDSAGYEGDAADIADAAAADVVADSVSVAGDVNADAVPVESADAADGPFTLFEVADPDAEVDDAWGVSAVRVDSESGAAQPGDAGAPESH
ncbi:DUF3027 domain-containing protein [Nocardia sp. NBC_01327]|uniref:DUF3027 domain-containing protein n=1 Tax=Nocardia sp. NBC_01327 TaxID=2903593 RepID=UPI003FA3C48A